MNKMMKSIKNINKKINKLEDEKVKLIKSLEDLSFEEFLENKLLERINRIEYKKLSQQDKVKCRVKQTTLYNNYINFLSNNNINIKISKSIFNFILDRNNINSIIHTGVKNLLLKKRVDPNELTEVMECSECKLQMDFDDYEAHINSKRCRDRQKILRNHEEIVRIASLPDEE
jgi:hypothetical protein